jgi:prevent-host-death family protein
MDRIVTATDANREFSKLLAEVADGNTVTITSHGTPVAKLSPAVEAAAGMSEDAWAARQAFVEELRSQPFKIIGPWTRDELYERNAQGAQ